MEFIEKIEALKSPRTFLPQRFDLDRVEPSVEAYRGLSERGLQSAGDLERWLLDWDELERILDQEENVRYVLHNCFTEDEAAEKRYKFIAMELVPECLPWADRLNRKYLESAFRTELDRDRFLAFDRVKETEARLFKEENIPLKVEETDLCSAYGKTCGSLMVEFEGAEHTPQRMALFLMDGSRPRREKAWRASTRARLEKKETFEGQFDRLMALRAQIARNAGFAGYTEYKFLERGRFDYGPRACFDFHESVESLVLPVTEAIYSDRRESLKLSELKPWDLNVEKLGRPPLKPFDDVGRLTAGARRLFDRLHPELGRRFGKLIDSRVLDLESRKGKRPGGFMCPFEESGVQFIFANAVGRHEDLSTLLHEAGHAFHSQSSAVQPYLDYRDAPLEIAEVASMGMELIAMDGYEEFYDAEESRRARADCLEDAILLLPWVATVDAFQHWLYANPAHSPEERKAAWLKTAERFSRGVDWTGLEEERAFLWHKQSHVFQSPHYYIEYGFAQLGAFQLWREYRRAPKETLERYIEGLSLGGSRPLPDLYEAVEIRFDFSPAMIGGLMEFVREEIGRLQGER